MQRTRRIAILAPLAVLAGLLYGGPVGGAAEQVQTQATVAVDGADVGRTFDGVGAVSAGASSRLLYDYPEPERSQILDYLFKPGYGASLQMLKVEIGSDTNSTDGSEASHMRERGEVDCDRGYEWWLMEEAVARNPNIVLLGLEWGAPGWFDGGFWSQDNIDYTIAWLDCAAERGLGIDFVGGWNERGFDADWYVELDAALAEQHPDVQIVAADECCRADLWRVADAMANDDAFYDAVDVVGAHFACGNRVPRLECNSTETAKNLNKPLWSSENSSMAHDVGAEPIARAINRMYIDADMTGFMSWSAISAWYSNLPIADTGLMLAEWPWSGHYSVGTSIWAYAHTTQFTQPGWRYLNTGSSRLESGATVASIASPSGDEFSTVIEAMDVTEPTTVRFELSNLPEDSLTLWSTDLRSDDPSDHMVSDGTIAVEGGAFEITLEPGHVYTVTSTTGQGKGAAKSDASVHDQLNLPFVENFEGMQAGDLARYFSDINGGFEAVPCDGGRDGMCYRQMVSQQPINWNQSGLMPPTTMVGDPRWWGDYALAAKVMLEQPGHVELVGRVAASRGRTIGGYHLQVGTEGWTLHEQDSATGETFELAAGDTAIEPGTWHDVRLEMRGDVIAVYLDGTELGRARDTSHRTGNVALRVSAWQNAQFDDMRVTPTAPAPRFVPKERLSATATSEGGFSGGYTYGVDRVVDDRPETSWSSAFNPAPGLPQAVTVDLGLVEQVQALTYQPRLDGTTGTISDYEVQLSRDGTTFTSVASGSWSVSSSTKAVAWDEHAARYVRLIAAVSEPDVCGVAQTTATAGEINVVRGPGPDLTTTPLDPPGPPLPEDAPDEFDQLVPQQDMTAGASSVHSSPYVPCKSIDGDLSTFWHSAPAVTNPLPATLTLDLGGEYAVQGLSYISRQDGNPNGNVTRYEIAVSSDGTEFTAVTSGAWADDNSQKYATWDAMSARFVRLTATAGHFNVAAAAELHVGYAP